jgi:hypothetical protein
MRSKPHVRFGGRARETDPRQLRHRARARPNGQHGRGLRVEEQSPGGVGRSQRRRWYPPKLEDPADRGCGDVVAELEQFSLDGESAWGAVAGFPRLRFPRPLSEPDVRLSPHPALHRTHAAGSMVSVGQADGIVVPLQR